MMSLCLPVSDLFCFFGCRNADSPGVTVCKVKSPLFICHFVLYICNFTVINRKIIESMMQTSNMRQIQILLQSSYIDNSVISKLKSG